MIYTHILIHTLVYNKGHGVVPERQENNEDPYLDLLQRDIYFPLGSWDWDRHMFFSNHKPNSLVKSVAEVGQSIKVNGKLVVFKS